MSAGKIAVLVDATLHNEIVLRTRSAADVSHVFDNVMRDFLDRTAGDDVIWSKEHAKEWEALNADGARRRYGDPKRGYHWETVFLPNGTDIRMPYKGRHDHAEIAHQRLMHDGQEYSPSQFASKVANNTSRNAWRDLEVRLPGTEEWVLADVLRQRAREAS